jgi:hypothetical protein
MLTREFEDLRARREAALKVIFDLKIYPDADHGRVGQPAVDEKVNAVVLRTNGSGVVRM